MIQQEARNKRVSSASRFDVSSRGKYQSGFTLVEIMVVMTMIAIMFSLGALAMMSANKQNQVLAAAREFQATVRQAANESITVSNATGTGIPAKAWSVAITSGAGSYSLDSYYPLGTIPSGATSAKLNKSSKIINLQNNIQMTVSVDGVPYSDNDVLNLIFSSPFARFNARNGTIDNLDSWDISANDEATCSGGSIKTGLATVKFSNGTASMDVDVTIDLGTGETSI